MNTDTGRIYTPEQMAEYEKLLKGIPTRGEFSLSDYIQKHKPDPRKMAEEILLADQENKLLKMKIAPTPAQMERGKVGRNEMCPCGSGIKFKKCHWTGHKI